MCGRQWVERGRGEDGQIIPSAWWDWMLGIDWSPNHRRKWAWKWMVLCPWLAAELGAGVGGMLAAERHGPNVHGTWFHLCLIYSYMILAKWSNKKRERGNSEGDVNQALLLEYYFFISSAMDALRKEQTKNSSYISGWWNCVQAQIRTLLVLVGWPLLDYGNSV